MLEGPVWDADNNVWIVGNNDECVIIDSPHDAETGTTATLRTRRSVAVVLAQ